jgi:hypothetical protein
MMGGGWCLTAEAWSRQEGRERPKSACWGSEDVRSVMEVDRRWSAAGGGQVGVGTARGRLRWTTAIGRLLRTECRGCRGDVQVKLRTTDRFVSSEVPTSAKPQMSEVRPSTCL